MKDLKDVVAMVVDAGGFGPSVAERLAKDYKKVYLCIPNYDAWSKRNEREIGKGIENIEVVKTMFGPQLTEIDLCVFPDVGFMEDQEHMIDLGICVWGGRGGERLEQDRPYCKEIMKDIGLPVGPFEIVTGTKALREYIKEHEDVWVKTSEHRGNVESTHAESYKEFECVIDHWDNELGPMKEDFEFVVEDSLPDMVESGDDRICIDGKSPDRMLAGIEIKSEIYVARCISKKSLPDPLARVDRALNPILREEQYRSFISTEVRIGKDRKPYLIDLTCRMGNPPFAIQMCMWKNYSEIIWLGANGILVEPEETHEFGVQVIFESDWYSEGNWQPVNFPEEYKEYVKISNCCKKRDQYYCVPMRKNMGGVGNVVGVGDSLQAAQKMAEEICEQVTGYGITKPIDSFEKAHKQIEKSKEFGINFFD